MPGSAQQAILDAVAQQEQQRRDRAVETAVILAGQPAPQAPTDVAIILSQQEAAQKQQEADDRLIGAILHGEKAWRTSREGGGWATGADAAAGSWQLLQ